MVGNIISWVKRHSLVGYFILAYVFSWAVEIPLALRARGLAEAPIPFSMHYLAAYGPLLSAILLTWLTRGPSGIREFFARMLKWRVPASWWVVAISPLALYVMVALVLRFTQGQSFDLRVLGRVSFLPDLGLGALPLWILTFGIGEEAGWRGYVLPRLQKNHNALSATIILWIFWALWHLPAFFYLYERALVIGFLLGLLAGAIVFTWLYNSTGGSVLIVAVFHGLFNLVTGCTACKGGMTSAVISTLIMVWAVVVVVVLKPANLSRRGKHAL